MNSIISVSNNQAFFKSNLNLVYALGGSTPAMFVPERQSEFTPLRIKMLKFMFRAFNFFQVTCYSQKTIARNLGCSRKAVNEAFMFFKEMKIIDFVSGKKNWTMNEYSLGEVLLNPYIRWALRFTFTNLTRAYFKMMERLKPTPKSAVVEPKVTQLTNVNVLELNTSYCSYRKRKYCKNLCLKQHKEDRLYSLPYLPEEHWINMKIAMWADWTLTEENYHKDIVTQKDYQLFYKDSDFTEEEIDNKIVQQAYQQEWHKKRYKNDMTSYQNYIGASTSKKPSDIESERAAKEFKSQTYQIVAPIRLISEDISIAKQKIEEAKKKSPNNFWLNKYAMPGTT